MGQGGGGVVGQVNPLGPVFISYRQSDGTGLAVALAWAVRAAGVPVWHDQTDLPPGDTAQRLIDALASGLSGAILVVTPEIENSDVVRKIELPSLLRLAEDPAFTFTIVSTIPHPEDPTRLDYGAPDRLLGTPDGTLKRIDQAQVATAAERAVVARAQARRRLEHLRPAVAAASGELLVDLQTRVPPYAATHDAHLVTRLRPPLDGQRRPHTRGLHDLHDFLKFLPQLIAIAGATSIRVRGGAHLTVACALGAAVPTTLLGQVHVTDTHGNDWHLDGQAPAPGDTALIAPVAPDEHRSDRGPVLCYVDLLSQRSDSAFRDFAAAGDFAGALHVRPVADSLLDPDHAAELVGEVIAHVRDLANAHGTTEVHLLLRCPYPIALLLGRCLNTLSVHLYEWEDSPGPDGDGPRYVPSLVLRSGAGGSPIHQVTASPFPTEEA